MPKFHCFSIESSQQRLDEMHDEVMKIQLKYQRELERLERENKELRKQMLLRGNTKQTNRKIKVRSNLLICMIDVFFFQFSSTCIILVFRNPSSTCTATFWTSSTTTTARTRRPIICRESSWSAIRVPAKHRYSK